MSNRIKVLLFFIILVDVLILGFLNQSCGPIFYFQLLQAVFMQLFALLLAVDSPISRTIAGFLKKNPATLKVAAFFLIALSFYLLYLASSGVPFQNTVQICD